MRFSTLLLSLNLKYANIKGCIILNSSVPNFRIHFSSVFFFFFLTNCRLERHLYVQLKDWMSYSIDADETAYYHLYLRCLQNPIIIGYGDES